ncbi:MAG TPA: alcohol dehydrogenase catalytic domain-containing protein, partial [Actinomycetota bacterium]
MSATMRALRKVRPGPGAELVEVPVPEPGEGEILVRVHAASVCGTDLHIYDWNEWAAGRIRTPMTFGHELAGHVAAVGPEVHHVQPGAFVAAETHIACGHCSTCRTGRAHICENLRILGVDTDGAFAAYVVIPAQNAWIVGEGIDPDAASIMEPFGNAVHATFGTAGGEDLATNPVAVIGCGPIGLFSVGIARA